MQIPEKHNWAGYQRILMVGAIVAAYANLAFAQFGVRQQDVLAMYLFNGQNETTFRQNLEGRTMLQLDRVAELTNLDAKQKAKLRLAVRGDLNRFYREMSIVRDKTKDLNTQNRADMQKVWKEMAPLQKSLATGLVGEGSLFQKILANTLDENQFGSFQQYLTDRHNAKVRALVRITVADLEKSVPLLADQREQLIELLETSKFPKKVVNGMETYVGYIVLAKANATAMSTILDDHQLKVVEQFQKQYAGFVRTVTW